MISLFDAAADPSIGFGPKLASEAAPNAFQRIVSLGLMVKELAAWMFALDWTMCVWLKGPEELLALNSQDPAVLCGTDANDPCELT